MMLHVMELGCVGNNLEIRKLYGIKITVTGQL